MAVSLPSIYPYVCNVVAELSYEIPSLALVIRPSLVSTEHDAIQVEINTSVITSAEV